MRMRIAMKSHSQIRTLLATYRDLDASDRAVVERHILRCASCAARSDAYQRMDRDLATLEDEFRPRRTASQMRAAAAAVTARETGAQHACPTLAVLVPIGLLLFLLIGALLVMQMSHSPDAQLAETPSTTPTPTTLVMLNTPDDTAFHVAAARVTQAPRPRVQEAPAPPLTVGIITPAAARPVK